MQNLYITTTLPYVNAPPHIGFALEIVQADTLARLWRILGYNVVFNTGTDEHGQKIYQKALEGKKDPQSYCDEYAAKFNDLKSALNLSYTNFIRTTDKKHISAAQEFWKRCLKNNDIYKKDYEIKYCVGCEMEKTESELVDGKCPLHPAQRIETIQEENYFFRFSKYQSKLLELYQKKPDFVIPDYRLKEIKTFVEKGLEDFSISRLKNKMPWGIDVPGDPNHVMYVWFDALINYISTLDWPQDEQHFAKFWPGIQVAGKDNLRQQSAMWQAMLMSANLVPSKQIFIHGFITVEGQKMSKSLGNVINPYDLVKKYGTDAVRYYLLREVPVFADGDFSHSRMREIYNSDLANELGNLVSRVTNLAQKDNLVKENETIGYDPEIKNLIERFNFNVALEKIWSQIKKINKSIDDFSPWQKESTIRKAFLLKILKEIYEIGILIQPFLPDTSQKIIKGTTGKITKAQPLFPKLI